MIGIKSQDVVVLLKLVSLQAQEEEKSEPEGFESKIRGESPYSVRNLESRLGISKTEVNASLKRILSTGMAIKDHKTGRPKTNRRSLYNFIVHGLKFVFPAAPGAMTRGIPTAFAAPMLKDLLLSGGNYIYVWPSAGGRDIGQSVQPLFKSVPEAAGRDAHLYEYLALVDAIRLGNQREMGLAKDRLSEKLLAK
jgi:predicted transcriptional regulator